jgi:hypothetical protein
VGQISESVVLVVPFSLLGSEGEVEDGDHGLELALWLLFVELAAQDAFQRADAS